MFHNFYIALTYRVKGKDDDITHPVIGSFYVDNWVWDEPARLLAMGGNYIRDISKIKIEDHRGDTVLEFEDKLNVRLLA